MPYVPLEVQCDILGARYGRDPWEYEEMGHDVVWKYWQLNQIRLEEEVRAKNKAGKQ